MTGNLQADGVQSRQTLFVRYCLKKYHTEPVHKMRRQIFGRLHKVPQAYIYTRSYDNDAKVHDKNDIHRNVKLL